MNHSHFLLYLFVVSFLNEPFYLYAQSQKNGSSFLDNYQVTWGSDHVSYLNQGEFVQLSLDNYTGSGFASKLNYGSGFFNMSIKLPDNIYTAGLIIAFYLTSKSNNINDTHDELDFEFLGHTEGKPYLLQTNVIANGKGNREQRMSLWFDPTADFHSYQFLWNPYHIVFYIDDVPVRTFKNNTKIGVGFPTQPMQVVASLWNGEAWATDQGRSKMNYTYGPFKAQFKGFDINGCPTQYNAGLQECYSPDLWWNGPKYWKLSEDEHNAYEKVKKKYLYYDYCNDVERYPNGTPLECNNLNDLSQKS